MAAVGSASASFGEAGRLRGWAGTARDQERKTRRWAGFRESILKLAGNIQPARCFCNILSDVLVSTAQALPKG